MGLHIQPTDSARKQLMLLLILLLLELTASIAGDLSGNGPRGRLYPYRPPVETIKKEDGDLVDCIEIYSQPAFDHPTLTNHTIQMEPSSHPEGLTGRKAIEDKANRWRSSCPLGTVPVLRLPNPMSPTFSSKFVDLKGYIHEHAILKETGLFRGTEATFNVWNPQTDGQNGEFSLAQLWVMNDEDYPNRNTIEAGWHVYPSLNGDSQPRLFVYWTRDNYRSTGCYNLKCPGFVQVSDQIYPGMAISPVSAYEGNQVYIDLLVFKDDATGNWWLRYNNINVGYWPGSLFTTLADKSNLLEWGGEVCRPANGPRLATKMGSGHFPSDGGDGISSSVKNIKCVDATNVFVQPTAAGTYATVKNCYDIYNVGSTASDGYVIYFGGPGKSDTCP